MEYMYQKLSKKPSTVHFSIQHHYLYFYGYGIVFLWYSKQDTVADPPGSEHLRTY